MKSLPTLALLLALLACNLLYYMPRQIALYQNFSGLSINNKIDLQAIYHPAIHHALVITDDQVLYGIVLFPLNDPLLRNDVIYAQASDDTQYATLHKDYPERTLYRLIIDQNGNVLYFPLHEVPLGTQRTTH